MNNVVHVPCDCLECEKNKKRLETFKKLLPFIERKIIELRVKTDLGLAGSVDQDEYDAIKDILPNVLGDKNES